ncbi:hypothetical protein M0D44_19815 [Xanthomonas prunicola]|uniref:hypothetical protein n=1 Tax=Xanthomonas prunicola TaxID=2053930 RepID=UPI0021B1EF75|nr:hypothetical protein [Xanthomonas prunicola]UXA48491.1 hypothetical protein M0D44_19815 [Xanthomonas prunicola]
MNEQSGNSGQLQGQEQNTAATLPPLPIAFFVEFGQGADDRVQDYVRAALAARQPVGVDLRGQVRNLIQHAEAGAASLAALDDSGLITDPDAARLASLLARQPVEQEPAIFVSPEQLEVHADPMRGEGGHYLPARKSVAGKFTLPLYTAPPAPAAVPVDGLRELLEDSGRIEELAARLVAPGPKAAHVSTSETHELSEWVRDAVGVLAALATHPQPAAAKDGDA